MTKREADDWTIERWKTEPRLVGLEFSDATVEQAPPLWKDLTLASALAVLLWALPASSSDRSAFAVESGYAGRSPSPPARRAIPGRAAVPDRRAPSFSAIHSS